MTKTSSIRIGLIARGDTGGLAAQTYDFYKHMKPDKTMLINLDKFTGQTTDESKYPDAYVVRNYPTSVNWDEWLRDIDLVFTVECPYDHELYAIARKRGIKTVEQYNLEWQQLLQQPELPRPDLFLSPSSWRQDEMKKLGVVKYLHVPIDTKRFEWRPNARAKKFLHIAGHKTMNDRNGTMIVLEAMKYIKSDVEVVIRTQDDLPPISDHRLTVIKDDVKDNRDLYDADVLLLPRRYGGLSLQRNEALALGMPVIMLDIEPNQELPRDWLVPATLKERTMIKTMIDVYDAKPEDLAKKIDEFADRNIGLDSVWAFDFAYRRRWPLMKREYKKVFNKLMQR